MVLLADRTNGRTYATVLCLLLSSSVTLCIAAVYTDSSHTRDIGRSW